MKIEYSDYNKSTKQLKIDSVEDDIDVLVIDAYKSIVMDIYINTKVNKLVFSEGIEFIRGICVINDLEEIVFPNSLIKIGDNNSNIYNMKKNCFYLNGLKKLDLSNCYKLSKLDKFSFSCEDLIHLELPNTNLLMDKAFNDSYSAVPSNLEVVKYPLIKNKVREHIFDNKNGKIDVSYNDMITDLDISYLKSIDMYKFKNLRIVRTNCFNKNIDLPKSCILFLVDLMPETLRQSNIEAITIRASNNIIIEIRNENDVETKLDLTYDIYDLQTGEDLYKLRFVGDKLTSIEIDIILKNDWNYNYIQTLSTVLINLYKIKNISIVINTLKLYYDLDDMNSIKTELNTKLLQSYFRKRFKKVIDYIVMYDKKLDMLALLINAQCITKENVKSYIKSGKFDNLPINLKNELIRYSL